MRKTRKLLYLLLIAALMLSTLTAAFAAVGTELDAALTGSAALMLDAVKAPKPGSVGGEWAVIGLARSGFAVPQEYWDSYYSAVEEYVKACAGILHERKYTEYSRVVLAITAIGADPRDVAGYDLLAPLGDFDKTVWQGVNGPVWALIALDSGNYDMPVNATAKTQATRQMYIDRILQLQFPDGGWGLGTQSDPDMTAMAIQALAGYREQETVRIAAEKALDCLSAMQSADGGFSSCGTDNCESVAQVIIALCRLGIDLEDSRFVKGGNTIMEKLMSFRSSDGSFCHTDGGGGNQMAFEQGLCALAAAKRATEGRNSLYCMGDTSISVGSNGFGLPGKHPNVKKLPITVPDADFYDIAGHENRQAITALASRSIINGMGDGSFAPDVTMTRAQFAAIVVRGLGLIPEATADFTDVSPEAWYAPYIGTAYRFGIITGRSDVIFDPNSSITRQEAAVMVARASKLCGMDTELGESEIQDILGRFVDQSEVAPWAREGLAFCLGESILDMSEGSIDPGKAILRCEIAQMLYNMLENAKLL